MKLHLAGDQKIDPDAFEKATLAELGHAGRDCDAPPHPAIPSRVLRRRIMRRATNSYLWSDVLTV